MISRKLIYFQACICIPMFFLVISCNKNIDYDWKSLDITVERGCFTQEGYFISEKIIESAKNVDKLPDKIAKFIYRTKSPFPLKIMSAQWKIIATYDDGSLQWGYQLVLKNDYPNDSLYIGIRRIIIELLDKDGFAIKKYQQSFENEPLGIYTIFRREEESLIKLTYPLKIKEAKRLKKCKMLLECSINNNYGK